jgi:hypothetical protein
MRNFLWLALLGLTACAGTQPLEHFDRHGERQGRYRIGYGSAGRQLLTRGRYRHGQAVGRWRYYGTTGSLDHRERYRRHGFSDITYYYPEGKVAYRGRARTEDGPNGLHFYWFGDWNYYSPAGAIDSVRLYRLGKYVSTRTVTKN